MYNIYFGKRSISLIGYNEVEVKNPNSVILYADNTFNYDIVLNLLQNSPSINDIRIYLKEGSDLEAAFGQLCSCFCEINAGGGLVRGCKGDYLFIYRYDVWDLPKGVQERDEEISQTALREVKEECGIEELELKEKICTTHHCYWREGKFMLKHTHWFQMQYTWKYLPVPQEEEDITRAKWVSPNKIEEHVRGTYPSIQEVLKRSNLLDS